MATTVSSPVVNLASTSTLTNNTGAKSQKQQRLTSHAVGSAANQVDKVLSREFSVTSGTAFSIDLTALEIEPGEVTALAHISLVHIQHEDTAGVLTPFGGTNGVFGQGTDINPSGVLVWHDPKSSQVIDGTHKVLQITADAGTIKGSLTVHGRTA